MSFRDVQLSRSSGRYSDDVTNVHRYATIE
jgi:hypothetical protein